MRALVHDDHALNANTLSALDEQGGELFVFSLDLFLDLVLDLSLDLSRRLSLSLSTLLL